MKPLQFGAALTLGLGVLAGGSGLRPSAGDAAGPVWRSDVDTARIEAQQTGKPLFVVFR